MDTQTTLYEIMVILLPGLGEVQTAKELDEVRETITSAGGKITLEDLWGIRDFAYTIKKHDSGYYAVITFEMEPTRLKELEKPLNLNQAIVRYLITKPPKGTQFITLEEYKEKWEQEAKEEAEEKEAKEAKKQNRRVIIKEKIKAEEAKKEEVKKEEKPTEPVKEEQVNEVKKEVVKEVVEKKKEEPKVEDKKDQEDRLKEVDDKLKSIIDDPDISL